MFTYKMLQLTSKLIIVNSIKQPQRALLFAPTQQFDQKKNKNKCLLAVLTMKTREYETVLLRTVCKK
jgi:hypothetical protein